ncbi:uncharacterized protein LOC132972920 isoform X2 [Labrus mixtus]|uniref:uncharacterized protein LOC132972920 isoform X2 n=1 Tax=Labrus mixtus TaxID=508554 RepID=UPI0029BFB836|nr:uncharacterized protein LOC132972920 isoform X2 [Labrus mixtus]
MRAHSSSLFSRISSVSSRASLCRFFHRMESLKMSIPIVDFAAFSINKRRFSNRRLPALSKQLETAFTEVGFVILKNTGINHAEVARVMEVSKEFFLMPKEQKEPFRRSSFSESENHGWVSLETESLNPPRPGDLKEAYNITSLQSDIKWPPAPFKDIHTSFYQRCKKLGLRVLRVMAHSLHQDPEVFLHTHGQIGSNKNATTLRSLYYPPVKCEEAKEGQLRCGEHSDYGSITLLFQGSEGLQVLSRSGEFIDAPCIPGAVLVNIADLMQRWTSDRFVSVRHRVLLPTAGDHRTRQSLAFFVHPDDKALISCCDGSDKYPPVTADEYLKERFRKSYG